MNTQIINHLTDTDLYKFTQGNAMIQHFPELNVRYKFIDRNKIKFPKGFARNLIYQIHLMKDIQLTESEEKYLKSLPFLTNVYVDFLKSYRFNPAELTIKQDNEGYLSIDIEGKMSYTIYWEVPLMALISELYFFNL